MLRLWIKWLLIAEDEPLFSCTNPYIEPAILVQEIEPSDRNKGVDLPQTEFVTPAYMTHQCARQFFQECRILDFFLPSPEYSLICYIRLHMDTWKTTSFRHCLVNTWKYTLRWMPRVGIMSSVFYYSCTWIATAKSIHKIHVTIFSVGKHKRHGHNTSQLTETVTNAEYEVTATICLAWLLTQGCTCRVHRYRMMLNEYSTWNSKETTFFSCHYLHYYSNLDIGVFGYFEVRGVSRK